MPNGTKMEIIIGMVLLGKLVRCWKFYWREPSDPIDITGPTITLNGNANMNVVLNGTADPGATADEGTITTSGTVDVIQYLYR